MPNLLLVILGGAAGCAARYSVAHWLNPGPVTGDAPFQGFPTGTLAVNLIGCLAIGLTAGWLQASGNANATAWRALLIAGVLGGFTTFSSFGMETVNMLRNGQMPMAAAYVLASNLGGVALAWAGFAWRVRSAA
jgi:CrcB protein